jgi:DNA (cytosine-5)-methyltransferase 1
VEDLTCIELFAGAGGASLGLHRASFHSLFAAEWIPNACETHRTALPSPVFEGDVRDLDAELTLKKSPTLMWASPPCQAFSSAGKRAGALDERNGWPWTLEILDTMQKRGCRPDWVICENVPGLTHHRGDCPRDPEDEPFNCPGCYWERWIIPEFKRRFDHVSVRMVDAADFGVPQRRRRIFLVAGPEPYTWPKPTHSFHNLVHDKWVTGSYWERLGMTPAPGGPTAAERKILESIQMRFQGAHEGELPWVTVREALGLGLPIRHQSPTAMAIQHLPDGVAPSVSGAATIYTEPEVVAVGSHNPHYHTTHDTVFASQLALDPKHPEKSIDEPSTAIRAGGDGNDAPHYWLKDGVKGAQELELDGPSTTIRAGGSVDADGKQGGGAPPYIPKVGEASRPAPEPDGMDFFDFLGGDDDSSPTNLGGSDPARIDRPSPTVSATSEYKGSGPSANPEKMQRASDALYMATGRRRLTVQECALLQGFPADYPFQGNKTSRYKQVGNAVCPQVSEALARALPIDRS